MSWQNGFRHNLAALADLAHSHGAVFIVDAAQSAGALDLDVRRLGIDFLAAPALKWLLGTPGIGYLYVSREQTERLTPVQAAYTGVISPFDPTLDVPIVYQPNATRYEVGMPSLPGMAASREGIELLRAVGMADVERQVLDLSGYCIERLRQRDLCVLTPEPAEQRAGVVGLGAARCEEAAAFLRERGVDVYASTVKSVLRIDPHFFNNRAEIDRLMDGLDELVRQEGRDALRP